MGARKKGCTKAQTTEIFCTICVDFQCQSRVKAKDLPVFCKWYNSTLFLFSVRKKKYYYHLSENFDRKFRKNGKHFISTSRDVPLLHEIFHWIDMNVIPLCWGVGHKDTDDISKPLFTIQPDFPERFCKW